MVKIFNRKNQLKAGPFREKGFDIETSDDNHIPIELLGTGHISCPNCGCNWFAVVKGGDTVSIGCQKCPFDARFTIPRQIEPLVKM